MRNAGGRIHAFRVHLLHHATMRDVGWSAFGHRPLLAASATIDNLEERISGICLGVPVIERITTLEYARAIYEFARS